MDNLTREYDLLHSSARVEWEEEKKQNRQELVRGLLELLLMVLFAVLYCQ